MAFGLVDSVMKNLNVKTWDSTYNSDSTNNVGTWYAAFYDMDTSFGRINSGAKLTYFTFSDYWFTNNIFALSDVTIYRDFFPAEDKTNEYTENQKVILNNEEIIGYDVPSSYLFAIAKYGNTGYEIGESGGNQQAEYYLNYPYGEYNLRLFTPQNLWAKWRLSSGPLANADSFIKKYFIRNLDNIPEQLWNMNYRLKYLKNISYNDAGEISNNAIAFESRNLQPFHGKGIYQLYDWLSGRLHILDSYFNLDGKQYVFKTLEYKEAEEHEPEFTEIIENDKLIGYEWHDIQKPARNLSDNSFIWKNIENTYDLTYDKTNSDFGQLAQNPDILILKDIFTTQAGSGISYPGAIQYKFKAKEYSPLTIVPPLGLPQNFLLIDPNTLYTYNLLNTTGSQIYRFYGSPMWTYIERLNSAIVDKQITVDSDNLETLYLDSGICTIYNIPNMKSLKYVHIEKKTFDDYSNFSGQLSFDGSAEDKYPNLTEIELINTNINLSVINEGVTSIKLLNSNCSTIEINSCKNLKNVILNNATISEKLTISPVWSDNIEISSNNIKKMDLSVDDSDGPRYINIKNDNSLEELILSNFTHINIEACTKLHKITITNQDKVESLKIIGCNTFTQNSNYITWISDDNTYENTIDLSKFVNLKEISFNSTLGFTTIILPYTSNIYTNNENNDLRGINLLNGAFGSTQLFTILFNKENITNYETPYLFITGSGIFSNCNISFKPLTGLDSKYDQTIKFYVLENVDNISYLFGFNNDWNRNNIGRHISEYDVFKVLNLIPANNEQEIELNTNTVINEFIYENIDNIKNISNLFSWHSQLGNNTTSLGKSFISISKFKNINNIGNIFYRTNFGILNDNFFSNDLQDTEIINISNFISGSNGYLTLTSHRVFGNIIDKITNFQLSGVNIIIEKEPGDDVYRTYINKLFKAYKNGSYVDFQLNNLEIIDGINFAFKTYKGALINITDDSNLIYVDYSNIFKYEDNMNNIIERMPNLKIIKNSFNVSESIQNVNKTINDLIENIFDSGLKEITDKSSEQNLVNFINSFNITGYTLGDPENHDLLDLIDLTNYLEKSINPLYANDENNNEILNFRFIKYIFKNSYDSIWNTLNYSAELKNINYLFANCIIVSNEDEFIFDFSDDTIISNKLPTSIKSAKYLFNNVKFIKINDDIIENIPLAFNQKSLLKLNTINNWEHAFDGITIKDNLPFNLFGFKNENEDTYNQPNSTNYNISYMFTNVKCVGTCYFKHETYNEICINDNKLDVEKYNNGVELEGSYHAKVGVSTINMSNIDNVPEFNNYQICGDETNINNVTKHLVVPFDIFYGFNRNVLLTGCFANSQFAGILPSKLFALPEYSNGIKDIFSNVLIIPNKYKTNLSFNNKGYKITSTAKSTDYVNNPNLIDDYNNTNKMFKTLFTNVPTYIFVPEGFTNDMTNLNGAFNFKILLPQSKQTNTEDNVEYYFIFANNSFKTDKVTSLINALPGSTFNYDKTRSENALIFNKNNDGEIVEINIRDRYEFHYGLMLPNLTNLYNFDNINDDEDRLIYYYGKTLSYTINNETYEKPYYGEPISDAVNYEIKDNSEPERVTVNGDIDEKIININACGIPITSSLIDGRMRLIVNPIILYFLYGPIFKRINSISDTFGTLSNIIGGNNITDSIISLNNKSISLYVELLSVNDSAESSINLITDARILRNLKFWDQNYIPQLLNSINVGSACKNTDNMKNLFIEIGAGNKIEEPIVDNRYNYYVY